MSNEEEVVVDLNNEEEVETEETVEETEETTDEVVEEKPRETLEERRARLKRQLEQTEKKLGITVKKPAQVEVESKKDLNSKDLIALVNAKINEEDIDDVVEYATFKKMSIAEALKSPVVKSLISEKEAVRKTANATNTGANKRSSTVKPTGETLLQKARAGEFPDDVQALVKARIESKKNQRGD